MLMTNSDFVPHTGTVLARTKMLATSVRNEKAIERTMLDLLGLSHARLVFALSACRSCGVFRCQSHAIYGADGLGTPNASIAPLEARSAFGNGAINLTPTWPLTFQTTRHSWEGRPNLDKTKLNWSGRSSALSTDSLAPSSEMSIKVHLCRRVSSSKAIHAAA